MGGGGREWGGPDSRAMGGGWEETRDSVPGGWGSASKLDDGPIFPEVCWLLWVRAFRVPCIELGNIVRGIGVVGPAWAPS